MANTVERLRAANAELVAALAGVVAALGQNATFPADIEAARQFARAALEKAKQS